MVNVITDIIINCPISKVSEYAANPDHAPKWYVNIDSAEWRTSKPLTVGSKIAFKAKFLGRELAYVYEIVDISSRKETSNENGPRSFSYEDNLYMGRD